MTATPTHPSTPGTPSSEGTPFAQAPTTLAQPNWFVAAWALFAREWMRFVRQRSRIAGALLTPAVFWVLLGSGLNQAAMIPNESIGDDAALGYRVFFFPGAAVMVLLFNTIFATYGLIEDKRDGLLRAMLVSPAPRSAAILGKLFGGASIATAQAGVFLLIWPWIAWSTMPQASLGAVALQMVAALGVLFLVAVGMTALGFLIAWPMNSSSGVHAILNLLLFPAWFLCGAVFPFHGADGWLKIVMYANPLTYGMSAFHAVLRGTHAAPGGGPPVLLALGLAVAVVAAMLIAVVTAAYRHSAE